MLIIIILSVYMTNKGMSWHNMAIFEWHDIKFKIKKIRIQNHTSTN